MSKTIIYIFLYFGLMACQVSPVSTETDLTLDKSIQSTPNTSICDSHANSGNCALLLSSIDYDFPDQECQVYDKLIQIDTKFKAPAGLKDGSIARVDWEFLPDGNAGFWTMPIEDTDLSEATIRVLGCFTFGEQDTLRIRRSITDHNDIESNTLIIDIPQPKEKINHVPDTSSEFEVLSYEATIF